MSCRFRAGASRAFGVRLWLPFREEAVQKSGAEALLPFVHSGIAPVVLGIRGALSVDDIEDAASARPVEEKPRQQAVSFSEMSGKYDIPLLQKTVPRAGSHRVDARPVAAHQPVVAVSVRVIRAMGRRDAE